MGDGGFSVKGDENYQEDKLKQLVLCQFVTAMMVLREGGSFLCKVFDLFSPFSVALVYLLSLHFRRFAIVKPVTSRPANSERYLVCEGFLQRSPSLIINYLLKVNDLFNEFKKDVDAEGNPKQDVVALVPLEMLRSHTDFIDYIRESNIRLAIVQIDALDLIWKYVEDPYPLLHNLISVAGVISDSLTIA